MAEEPSDEALMRRLACDETAAFDALYVRHRRAVFNYIVGMVGDVGTGEDLTQECFLRVWRARCHYQPTAAFRTWLFTIARRLALDALKRRTPVAVLSADAEADPPMTPELADRLARADPEAIFLGRELERQLERAIQELPQELHEIVVLRTLRYLAERFLNGASLRVTPAELATALGVEAAALHSALTPLISREWLRWARTASGEEYYEYLSNDTTLVLLLLG